MIGSCLPLSYIMYRRLVAAATIECKVSENITPTKEELKENTHFQIGKSISF
jgi:hypothetical protein